MKKRRAVFLCLMVLLAGCSKLEKLITGVEPQIDKIEMSQYQVDPGDTVTATVILAEGDEPMSFKWKCDAGQFLPPSDEASVVWQAPVTGGDYTLSVTVENDIDKDKAEQQVTVRSYTEPAVSITHPASASVFTQYQRIDLTVQARHDNGIRTVRLHINGVERSTLDGNNLDLYTFDQIELNEAGTVSIEVIAEARTTGSQGSASIEIEVEGVVLGKKQN